MKKVTLIILCVLVIIFSCCSCNKQFIDTTYSFDYCIIKMPDGTTVEGDVESWTDFEDGDQLQIKVNGDVYLVHSINCTMIKKGVK